MSRQYLTQLVDMMPENKLARFILENGKEYQTGPKTYSGRRMEAGQCYSNATHMVLDNPRKYTYVEGYVSVLDIQISHAWVINKKGIVVDPTLTKEGKFIKDRAITDYFGIAFSEEYLRRTIIKNGYYGLLDYGFAYKTLPDLVEGRADFKPKLSQEIYPCRPISIPTS